MKSAVFLYNTQSGKCKIGHCTDSICTVFRAYGYEITPQPIDFEANPFDGNEQISLMVVAGGDGTVNYVVNSMKARGWISPWGVIPAGTANDFAGRSACRTNRSKQQGRLPRAPSTGWIAAV